MKISNEEIRKILATICVCQSLIHHIDDMRDCIIDKQKGKNLLNKMTKFLENTVNMTGRHFDIQEAQYYTDIVNKIDSFTKNIIVEQ